MSKRRPKKRMISRAVRYGFFWGALIFLLTNFNGLWELFLAFPISQMVSYLLQGDGNAAFLEFGSFVYFLVNGGLFGRFLFLVLITILFIWILLFVFSQLKNEKKAEAFENPRQKAAWHLKLPKWEQLPKLPNLSKYKPTLPVLPKEAPDFPNPQLLSSKAWVKTKLVLGHVCYGSFQLEDGSRIEFQLPKEEFQGLLEQESGQLSYIMRDGAYEFANFVPDRKVSAEVKPISEPEPDVKVPEKAETISQPAPEVDERVKELRTLKSLLDEGLITEDDYEAKKRQLLNL